MWRANVTLPRIVRPGQTIFLTRRVVCRSYLFRPDRELTEGFLYCLGYAAQKHGIILHVACLMSTHVHLVFTDPRGVAPDFYHDFFRLFANFVKVLRGWGHEVFDAAGPSGVDCRTDDAIVRECAYTLANPVACGAVRYAREWPGFSTRIEEIGKRTFDVKRPKKYFDPEGKMPKRVEFRFEHHAGIVERNGVDEARTLLVDALFAEEEAARREVQARGHKFLGAERVLKKSPFDRAKSYEVFGALNPRFATKRGGEEAYIEAAENLLTFQADYRDAWERWRAGGRNVVFPYGTWLMRVRYHVRCAQPP
jgi:putative transposase